MIRSVLSVFLSASCLCVAGLSGAAFSQQTAPDEAASAPLSFPEELILLPENVQAEARSGEDAAETVEIPDHLGPVEEAWYRAQVAYIGEDWFAARRYAETAAVGGNVEAALLSGIMARDGRGGDRDLQAAVGWFRRAADQGEPVALYQLGLLARLDDASLDLGEARSWFERAARGNHIAGMVAYAVELRNSPLPQEQASARQWAERAAQQDSAEGMYQLARLYDEGIGGARDADGARVWYLRAAEKGHGEAAFQAGMMWADGAGGEADDREARRWLRVAAESNYAPAQGQYGLMLYQGRGGPALPDDAAYWFERGAQGGDAESQFLYAFVLARGEGVEQDFETAYRWTLAAATDALGAPVHDRDRDRLQAGLEGALPPDVSARIRAEMGQAD